MNLEAITLRLRPRGAYEAMDLGVRLLQRNAGSVYLAWCVVVLPVCLAVTSLASIAPWLPAIVIWWLKPFFDRVVLFVLSRAVFGEQVGLRDLRWRFLLGNGLVWALTLRRFDFARSFNLPVYLLEGLRGKRRRQRITLLQKNTRAQAVLLTTAFIHFEIALWFSLLALCVLMLPHQSGLPLRALFTGDDAPLWLNLSATALSVLTTSICEPVYVACGFTLYLNRRVELEAWDIEVDLRRNLPADSPPLPREVAA